MAVERPDVPAAQGSRRRPRVPWRLRLTIRSLSAACAFVVVVVSGYAWATYQNFSASVPHGDPLPALPAGHRDLDGADQDIFLLGNDSRAGAPRAEQTALTTGHDDGTVNTDTM